MNHLIESVRSGGRHMTILGVISIILGIFALMAPGIAGLSVAVLLGLVVLAAGVVRMLWAFRSDGVWSFALGSLTFLCGVALLANPLFASGVLAVVLAAYFILDGVFEIGAGFGSTGPGRGWLVFAGVISILLGAMIWAQFPWSGAWAMGILLGIKLFLVGLVMIAGGSTVRAVAMG
jgi:uncharacterized membrane protein HdeD (DUF308 family)